MRGRMQLLLAGAAVLLTASAGHARPAAAEVQRLQPAAVDAEIKKIVFEHLGVDLKRVTPNARFVEDLGADDLDIVEMVMAFEEAFDITYPDDDAEKMRTVGDAMRFIKAALAKR